MTANPTNDFNSLGILSQKSQNRLLMFAMNGDSIANPLDNVPDREGVTPQGRARKEREKDQRMFRETMAHIEERRVEFLRELDRREQACIEALHENEEQMRAAQKELQTIRDRAYELTLPDGSTTKVYRDGNKVRMENGAEVGRDLVKPEDLGDQRPSWSSLQLGIKRVDDLNKERDAITAYRQKIGEARQEADGADITADELNELGRSLDRVRPPGVAAKEATTQAAPKAQDAAPAARDVQKLSERFAAADRDRQAADAQPVLSDADFETIRKPPSVSAPAAR